MKCNAEHSVESINNSVRKKENQVDESIKSNDESGERLEPPPIASTVGSRSYRPAEVLSLGDSKGFRERKKNTWTLLTRGGCSDSHVRYTWVSTCILITVFKC